MKALVLQGHNLPFALQEVEKPVAGKGQVLVRILASGVNPLDLKIKSGQAAHAQVKLPAILGIDMAGVVEAVGQGVDTFKPGDEVYGMVGSVGGLQGTLAEYIAADANLLAIKPKNLSFRQAAALPLILITAWEGLIDRAHITAGTQVLIQGGAGGVGHIATQLAKALGADVYATVSPDQFATIQGYQATPIDYTESPDAYTTRYTQGNGFDVVYDTVGGTVLDTSFTIAKRYTGHVVSILGWGTHSLAPLSFRSATYSGVFTLYPLISGHGRANHGNILTKATSLIEIGRITPLLDTNTYTLESINNAYEALQNRTTTGKVVIDI